MAISFRSTVKLGVAAAPLLALSLPLAPARAAICPDGTEAEFCFPPPAPPVVPPVVPVLPPVVPGVPVAPVVPVAPAPPLAVNVYRTDARLQPLGLGRSWQVFGRDLLEILPQKVPFDPNVDYGVGVNRYTVPGPETPSDPAFRFSTAPGAYYAERTGWRLRVFGDGFGGPVVRSSGSVGTASFDGAQLGLRLDYAFSRDLVAGVFGRFGQGSADGGSLVSNGTSFGGQSSDLTWGGGGLFAQWSRPGWFISGAIGGDGLSSQQPFAISSSNATGVRSSSPSVGGSAFNTALNFGGRIRLSETQLLEPSALLTTSSLSFGQVSIPDGTTNQSWELPSTSSTVGTADIGVTWRAPMQQGKNLITPSLRVSWLGAGFLGGEPATVVSSSSGSQATLATGSLVQSSGLGLQGQLAYTLGDNTTFYVRGGAGLYSGGTAWDVGGGVKFRWGAKSRAVAAAPVPQPAPAPAPVEVPAPAPQPIRGLW
jgi:hypothetical protein